jgi:agmatine deiminase
MGLLALAGCALRRDASDEGLPAPTPAGSDQHTATPIDQGWAMPDEAAQHERTWMAFGASREIWGSRLLPEVQRNLADLASTIVEFEPVSMLVREADVDRARGLVAEDVELIVCDLDDAWIRDSGPVFVGRRGGGRAAVSFNFNGWGEKQAHDADSAVASKVAAAASIPVTSTELVLEGGAIEVDGAGTAILAESCVLNDNRNPGWTREQVEVELERLLGITTVIWLPGIAGRDITDGHTDFYARFAGPGVVVAGLELDRSSYDYDVTREHLRRLQKARDSSGRQLNVVSIPGPSSIRERYASNDFAAGYVNFYVCNGGVVVPEFGDLRADRRAQSMLDQLFASRDIVAVAIDGIAAGGGGIHCVTQQQPAFV